MEKRADVVLFWHMHQPDYRDHATGEFAQPWVYLHAIKDYTDMAAHLERHPQVRAVVNFVPVLLDQLEDYADQFATGRAPRSAAAPAGARPESTPLDRAPSATLVLDRCFHANHEKMVQPYPAYEGLHDLFTRARAPGPRRDRLSLRPVLPRPRHLVSPRVDRRNGAARRPSSWRA